jgi:hypothetical protein
MEERGCILNIYLVQKIGGKYFNYNCVWFTMEVKGF